MEEVFLDPFSSDAGNRDRSAGPFGTDETLPAPVLKWKNRVHPVTKERTYLLDFDWECAAAKRIIASLEQHTHHWTLNAVKKREAFDRADNSDSAQSLFVLDRTARLITKANTLRALRTPVPANQPQDAAAQAAAAVALRVRQEARADLWIADANDPTVAADKPALMTACSLTPQEFLVYKEFTRVYDSALCHFLPECCATAARRFLNAERIKADNAANPTPLKWEDYKKKLLERMNNNSKSNELISYILKTREESLPATLWVAERRSERSLLEVDNIAMPEETWLSFTTAFLNNEERIALSVPADKDLAAHNQGNGYTMTDLEAALSTADADTFKMFRTSSIRDPVAKRLLRIQKAALTIEDSPKRKKKPSDEKKNLSANESSGGTNNKSAAKTPMLTGPALQALDLIAALPAADVQAKWKDNSLRTKLVATITAKKCIRCGDAHRRHLCKADRKQFEDDFDRGAVFWKSPQHRPQWLTCHSSDTLYVEVWCGVVGIDTGSDISTALEAALANIRPCAPLRVQHVGGFTTLDRVGTFVPHGSGGRAKFVTCYVVTADQLPPGRCAIFGMAAIRQLDISLDALLRVDLRPPPSPTVVVSADAVEVVEISDSDEDLPDLLALSSDSESTTDSDCTEVGAFAVGGILDPPVHGGSARAGWIRPNRRPSQL